MVKLQWWDDAYNRWSLPRVMQAHAWVLRYMNEAVAITRGQLDEQEPRLAALEARRRAGPRLGSRLCDNPAYLADVVRKSRAVLRCAVAGLAAERHRQQHGRWPEHLDELVRAGLLTAVPMDPYSAQALRLRRTEDGLVVYSVGPKGTY